ncbi:MAG TPA: chemotaxis protein CheW, partial [Planctomycetia bacterium]|nr:chemotaxis protein CheW [Planctomycetia bacterium]
PPSAPPEPAASPGPTPIPLPTPTPTAVSSTEPASPAPPTEPVEFRGAVAESVIRVDVGLLDKLMNAVGELVLARNQILQHAATSEDAVLVGAVQRLNQLTTELQAGVMKTRMQPVGAVWGKYPRLVRDLAVACGKQVRFDMVGHETELDKTVLEAIRDPLTHMVRNAVDHGLEEPAARAAAGKSPEGHLRLHAFHEGGKVVIEVADDGAGIDPRRVLDKAIRLGLLVPAAAERLSEREVLELIFRPGFSTADKVTQFSGRGVGMDVVRTNVERIGGTVELESKLGQGAAFRMKIPLTLAIIPALVVGSRGERFAIPQVSLLELVRLDGERAERGVERVHGAPVFRLRGNLLPLAFLDRELGLAPPGASVAADALFIVVLQVDDRQLGLVVDAVLDTEEIVVKPLQQQLKRLDVYAGATIMGDGRVALILDVLGIARRAGLAVGKSGAARPASTIASAPDADVERTLIFVPRAGGRMAMSLERVARLEEFPRSTLERVGDRMVVQYRGSIMPLVDVGELLGDAEPAGVDETDAPLQVVVHEHAGRRIGLLVGRILDVADEAAVARAAPLRSGVLFNGVVRGAATEFIDLAEVLRRAERLLRPAGEGVPA